MNMLKQAKAIERARLFFTGDLLGLAKSLNEEERRLDNSVDALKMVTDFNPGSHQLGFTSSGFSRSNPQSTGAMVTGPGRPVYLDLMLSTAHRLKCYRAV